MLTDLLTKIKSFLKENQRDLYLAALVFLVSVASFGLGRLSAIWPQKEPITIENHESGFCALAILDSCFMLLASPTHDLPLLRYPEVLDFLVALPHYLLHLLFLSESIVLGNFLGLLADINLFHGLIAGSANLDA